MVVILFTVKSLEVAILDNGAVNATYHDQEQEDKDYFNIHGTKYFKDAVFHQASCTFGWPKTRSLHEILTRLVITEKPLSGIFSSSSCHFYRIFDHILQNVLLELILIEYLLYFT